MKKENIKWIATIGVLLVIGGYLFYDDRVDAKEIDNLYTERTKTQITIDSLEREIAKLTAELADQRRLNAAAEERQKETVKKLNQLIFSRPKAVNMSRVSDDSLLIKLRQYVR